MKNKIYFIHRTRHIPFVSPAELRVCCTVQLLCRVSYRPQGAAGKRVGIKVVSFFLFLLNCKSFRLDEIYWYIILVYYQDKCLLCVFSKENIWFFEANISDQTSGLYCKMFMWAFIWRKYLKFMWLFWTNVSWDVVNGES